MKLKRLLVLFLVLTCVFSLVACNKEPNLDEEVDTKTEVKDNENPKEDDKENTSSTDNVLLTQNINKSDLGLTMELTGNYSDCKIVDLDENGYKAISDKAIAGFNIVKTINGSDYILSTVAVVDSSATASAQDRAKFPYIFAGNGYSIVATLPTSNVSDSAVFEQISQLQAGIMQQLCTIFFDESALKMGSSSETDIIVETDSDTSTSDDSTVGNEESSEGDVENSNDGSEDDSEVLGNS